MFDQTPHRACNARHADDVYGPVRTFLQDHREAIENASGLLGGARGAKLARGIADELVWGDEVSRRCLRRLHELLDLLALEHVGDPDRDEADFFTEIDLSSPVVEEICLLTDAFRDALEQAAMDQPPASRSRAAA